MQWGLVVPTTAFYSLCNSPALAVQQGVKWAWGTWKHGVAWGMRVRRASWKRWPFLELRSPHLQGCSELPQSYVYLCWILLSCLHGSVFTAIP